ncbi:RICIN domain-containing protein [Lentzea sp. NPDC058450]|uniref:RICIN domain-containing protein n=1 Tax=Lentzea sp. NPDC058450 TaxID=3346505 RepID=UPI003655F3EC
MGMKLLGIALSAIALGAVMVAPAGAAEDGNELVEIRSVLLGECLQAAEEPHRATMLPCTGGKEQYWEVVPVGEGRNLLRSVANHRQCLSERYNFYYCEDEAPHGFASMVPEPSGAVRIRFGDSDAFMKVSSRTDGTQGVLIVPWGERDEQQWEVRTVGTTGPSPDTTGQVVRIRSAETERYGCAGLSGTRLLPVPCADVPEQRFQRIEVGPGVTALRSVANGKCLSLWGAGAVEPEVTQDCVPADARQQWSIEPTKLGSARLRNATGEKFLTPGTGWVFMTEHYSNTWQQWDLVPA